VHCEGAQADYPPLFIPSATTLTEQTTPHLLLAFGMGMLKKARNTVTGKDEIVYTYTDKDGFANQLVVGESEKDALTKMPSDTALTVQRKVEEAVSSDDYRLAEKRKDAFDNVVVFINAYKDSCLNGDANSPEYLRLRKAALEAKSRLLKLD